MTVIADVPVLPSLEAVIVALPAATAETRPDAETVAMAALPEDQLMVRPVKTFPLASRVTAESCVVAPACKLAVAGDTATVATGIGGGAVTVNPALPVLPSLEAVIVAVPAATPAIIPLAAIAATPVFELCQLTVRPESEIPAASLRVALACADCPATIDDGTSATSRAARITRRRQRALTLTDDERG